MNDVRIIVAITLAIILMSTSQTNFSSNQTVKQHLVTNEALLKTVDKNIDRSILDFIATNKPPVELTVDGATAKPTIERYRSYGYITPNGSDYSIIQPDIKYKLDGLVNKENTLIDVNGKITKPCKRLVAQFSPNKTLYKSQDATITNVSVGESILGDKINIVFYTDYHNNVVTLLPPNRQRDIKTTIIFDTVKAQYTTTLQLTNCTNIEVSFASPNNNYVNGVPVASITYNQKLIPETYTFYRVNNTVTIVSEYLPVVKTTHEYIDSISYVIDSISFPAISVKRYV